MMQREAKHSETGGPFGRATIALSLLLAALCGCNATPITVPPPVFEGDKDAGSSRDDLFIGRGEAGMRDGSPGPADSGPPSADMLADGLPTDGAEDALPTDGAGDALPTDGAEDALPTDGAEDALPTDGAEDALPTDGAEDALLTDDATED